MEGATGGCHLSVVMVGGARFPFLSWPAYTVPFRLYGLSSLLLIDVLMSIRGARADALSWFVKNLFGCVEAVGRIGSSANLWLCVASPFLELQFREQFKSVSTMPAVELHTGSNGSYNGEIKAGKQTVVNGILEHSTDIFEYTSSANPEMIPIPIQKLDAKEHMTGPTRVTALDTSKEIGIEDYPATSPNLLASFVRICVGESVTTNACATSQAFYIIHGRGKSQNGLGVVEWSTGDLFVFPSSSEEMPCTHSCLGDEDAESGGAGLYWVSDAPLLSYLGVAPKVQKFKPAYFSQKLLLDNVENVRHEPGAEHRNRLGILLGNKETSETKTLTHVLWSLLNVLPPGEVQRPHRHNSVALDLAVKAAPGTYTLMGKELDSHGWVRNPVRVDWTTGSIFITPPGWWHSHHNDSQEEAWVLPIQDAGLYTHQRTLDIRFSDDEVASKEKKAASQMRPREEFHNSEES